MLTPEEKATNFETYEHINVVMMLLGQMQIELMKRQFTHDRSKLAPPEVDTFTKFTPRLKTSTYGSDEYRGFLREMKPALDHHYQENKHHPEWVEHNVERWVDIEGYEDYYQVSNLGQIRAVQRVNARSGPTGNLSKAETIRKAHVTPKGYLRLQLVKDGVTKNHLVHTLVAKAFVPNPENKPQVNHKDGDKQNNYYQNLEWSTSSENLQHSYDIGLRDVEQLKYVVTCVELDITTYGSGKMALALKERGYGNADAVDILRCINEGGSHLGLTFTGEKIEAPRAFSYVNRMNLIDVLEMVCDWYAASKRHDDGNPYRSLEINTDRFHLEPQLVAILKNTIDLLQRGTVFDGLKTQSDLYPDS